MNITPSGFIRPAIYCDPETYELLKNDTIPFPVSDFLGVPVHVQSQGKGFVPPYDRLRYIAEKDASGAFLDLAEAAGKMTESSLDSLATLLELMWRIDSRFDGKLVVVEPTKPTKPWVRMEGQ